MTYLKTYFYAQNEIEYLIYNLMESYQHIDKFIICEFNRTHTGHPRDFIYQNCAKNFPKELIHKITYLKCDISSESIFADRDENATHKINEPLMRGYFVKCLPLMDDDIVISVDADEIIYSESYPEIISSVKTHDAVLLSLHNFYYKKTYLWKNCTFNAPTAAKYSFYKYKYPANWRYDGFLLPQKVGCHFSACMDIDSFIYKLQVYSHPQYRHFANKDILIKAIENKEYIFDKTVKFEIEEKIMSDPIYPRSMRV